MLRPWIWRKASDVITLVKKTFHRTRIVMYYVEYYIFSARSAVNSEKSTTQRQIFRHDALPLNVIALDSAKKSSKIFLIENSIFQIYVDIFLITYSLTFYFFATNLKIPLHSTDQLLIFKF